MSLFIAPAKSIDPGSILTRQFALVVVVYPVLEEIAFRGSLQCYLRSRSWGPKTVFGISAANIVTSIVFTAFHIALRPSLWSAGVLAPSLVFGFFRDRYGNLYAPIALHAFYNAGLFVLFMS